MKEIQRSISLRGDYDVDEKSFISSLCSYDFKIGSCVSRLMKPISPSDFNDTLDELDGHLLNKEAHGIGMTDISGGWVHANGVSSKTMTLAPLSIVTGKEHKFDAINTVAEGSIAFFTHDGPIMFRAGDCFTSSLGGRKVGITMPGVTFINSFPNPNNVRDEDALNKMFFIEPPAMSNEISGSYEVFLEMTGLNEDSLQEFMRDNPSHTSSADDEFDVRESEIAGDGLFAKRDMGAGEEFPLVEFGNRTIIARYSNHSFNPHMEGNDDVGVLLRDVKKGEEVTMNYYDNIMKTTGGVKCLAGL